MCVVKVNQVLLEGKNWFWEELRNRLKEEMTRFLSAAAGVVKSKIRLLNVLLN